MAERYIATGNTASHAGGQGSTVHRRVHTLDYVNSSQGSFHTFADTQEAHVVDAGAAPAFVHPTLASPILKHIPRASRVARSTCLTNLLFRVSLSPDDVEAWAELLRFGGTFLLKSARGGSCHNLANPTRARCEQAPKPTAQPHLHKHKSKEPDACLAAAVASKI